MQPVASTNGPGPVGEAQRSEARPEDMRSRTTALYRGNLEQNRVTSEWRRWREGGRPKEGQVATHVPDTEPEFACHRSCAPTDRSCMGRPSPEGRSRLTSGARCVSSARRDLCKGERGNPPPHRDQCAPKARNTREGRCHPERRRLIWYRAPASEVIVPALAAWLAPQIRPAPPATFPLGLRPTMN